MDDFFVYLMPTVGEEKLSDWVNLVAEQYPKHAGFKGF